jgi:hypothetical protein
VARYLPRVSFKLSFAACALAALALVYTGCGGSSEPDPALISHANAICEKYYDQEYAMKPPIGMAQLQKFADVVTKLREDRVKDLQDLNPPAAESERFNRFVDGLDQENQLIEELIAAESAASSEEIRKRGQALDESVRRQAHELGLTWCEKDAGTAPH